MTSSKEKLLKKNVVAERVTAWADREIDRVCEDLRARGWGFVALLIARYADFDESTGGAPSSAAICAPDARVLPAYAGFAESLRRLADEVDLRYRQSGENRETFGPGIATVISKPVPDAPIDPGWLVKDFHVLYRTTRELLLAVGRGEESEVARRLNDCALQMDRLKPAYEMTEGMRREGAREN